MRQSTGRKRVFSVSLFSLSVIASAYGCVSIEGPATQLQLSPGFQPKKAYNYSYDQMWEKVLLTLRKQRIMVTTANKDSGIIDTDYVPGWTVDIAAIGTESYRYKYQIAFQKNSPSQTQIEIISKLESKRMAKGGAAREAVEQLKPWEDVTYRERKNVTQLEYWLYEQIEKSL